MKILPMKLTDFQWERMRERDGHFDNGEISAKMCLKVGWKKIIDSSQSCSWTLPTRLHRSKITLLLLRVIMIMVVD